MDEDEKTKDPNIEVEEISAEEKESEAEALAEVKDEELKSKIAEDLGINPEDEPELINKIVEKEKAQREKLSGAIKQKISWREKATKKTSGRPKDTPKEGEPHTEGKPLTAEELDRKLDEREAKRDLEGLGLPEEIETEVKDLAKVKGISVREAAKLPYIVSAIEEVEKEKRIESATPKRKSRGNYASANIDPSKPLDPAEFALDTKKGRKAWAEAKVAKREYESQQ